MKVRKKPVEVEAVRYDGAVEEGGFLSPRFDENPQWLYDALRDNVISLAGMFTQSLRIMSTEYGELTCNPGDWIIRGLDGELYPCTNERFEQIYEAVS